MKKFIEENIDIVSLFPIVTTRSTGTVLEESFGLTGTTRPAPARSAATSRSAA